jgi:hypothetical protein
MLEDQVELDIEGLRVGAKVWGLWGDARTPVALPARIETDVTLVVDMSTVPFELESIDLTVWTQGRQVAVIDLRPTPSEEPPDEEPETDDDTPGVRLDDGNDEPAQIVTGTKGLSTGGCSAVTGYPGWVWLVSLLGLLTTRRTPCDMDGC